MPATKDKAATTKEGKHRDRHDHHDEGTVEEKLGRQLAQAAAENEGLQHRISQLAGYQTEVTSLREQVETLNEDLASIIAERDGAVRDASRAKAEAKDAQALADSLREDGEAAQAIAAALKKLLK